MNYMAIIDTLTEIALDCDEKTKSKCNTPMLVSFLFLKIFFAAFGPLLIGRSADSSHMI